MNTREEVNDLILHEIAHALVGGDHGHDEVWKAKCVEIGARPERCYGLNARMPKRRMKGTCDKCGHTIIREELKLNLRNMGYFHDNCGGDYKWKRLPVTESDLEIPS